MDALKTAEALDLLRHCLKEGQTVLGRHFREEMAADGLTAVEAYHVLRTGAIYNPPEPDIKTGEWKHRIEGREPDGRWLVIVFCFKKLDTVFLITIWSVSEVRR